MGCVRRSASQGRRDVRHQQAGCAANRAEPQITGFGRLSGAGEALRHCRQDWAWPPRTTPFMHCGRPSTPSGKSSILLLDPSTQSLSPSIPSEKSSILLLDPSKSSGSSAPSSGSSAQPSASADDDSDDPGMTLEGLRAHVRQCIARRKKAEDASSLALHDLVRGDDKGNS
jgi:hypothetical protein